MTTLKNMMDQVIAIYKANEDNYNYIGLRFENADRQIGDICNKSRHGNGEDRDDDRTFPEFTDEDYDTMIRFDGTSAWDLSDYKEALRYNRNNPDNDMLKSYEQDHCYIIAGQYNCNQDDGLDYNEVVIEDAKVIAIIF